MQYLYFFELQILFYFIEKAFVYGSYLDKLCIL